MIKKIKPMSFFILFIIISVIASYSLIQANSLIVDYNESWTFITEGNIANTPTIGDILGDTQQEIIFISNDNELHCINSIGINQWNYTLKNSYAYSSPTICDLTYDGTKEIIVSTATGNVLCFNNLGGLIWNFTVVCDYFTADPAVDDIDGDNLAEIIIGGGNLYKVYCISNLGISLWNYTIAGYVNDKAILIDLDDDTTLETIIAESGGYVYCIDHTGATEWAYYLSTAAYNTPLVSDLDEDGFYEIVVTCINNNIYCLTSTGTLLWDYTALDRFTHSSPFSADLDEDGYEEILAGDFGGNLYCLTYEGNLNWRYTLSPSYYIETQPKTFDFDGDGTEEVILVCNSKLYTLSSNGELIGTYSSIGTGQITPVIANIDADEEVEFIIGTSDIYCLEAMIITPTQTPTPTPTPTPSPSQTETSGISILTALSTVSSILILTVIIKKNGKR